MSAYMKNMMFNTWTKLHNFLEQFVVLINKKGGLWLLFGKLPTMADD